MDPPSTNSSKSVIEYDDTGNPVSVTFYPDPDIESNIKDCNNSLQTMQQKYDSNPSDRWMKFINSMRDCVEFWTQERENVKQSQLLKAITDHKGKLIPLYRFLIDKGLISKENINEFLYHAISHKLGFDAYHFLLEKGADLEDIPRETVDGMIDNKEYIVLIWLLNNGLPVEGGKGRQYTLMEYAVRKNNTTLLEILLRNGVDPNYRDSGQGSVLQITSSCGRAKMMKLMLEYGADRQIRCNIGFNAYIALHNQLMYSGWHKRIGTEATVKVMEDLLCTYWPPMIWCPGTHHRLKTETRLAINTLTMIVSTDSRWFLPIELLQLLIQHILDLDVPTAQQIEIDVKDMVSFNGRRGRLTKEEERQHRIKFFGPEAADY